jgi:hypothetical protein
MEQQVDNMSPQQYVARKNMEEAMKKAKAEDLEKLAMAVALEARGEKEKGMFAVARSIINRHRLIHDEEVLPSTFMPGSTNKKPTFMDLLTSPKQYAVVDDSTGEFIKQDSPVTAEDLELARQMIQFASNDDTAQFVAESFEIDPKILTATGFRTRDANYDASQDVDTFMVGNHQFNRAGVPDDE